MIFGISVDSENLGSNVLKKTVELSHCIIIFFRVSYTIWQGFLKVCVL